MTAAPDLSALVSARLCHDLISPLGAIGNGIELLQMTGNGRARAELALVSDSLSNALGKLRFFRIAFGAAEPDVRQSLDEIAQITAAAFQGRFSASWATNRPDLPRPVVKTVCLALLCLERSLPLGGEVRIDVADGRVSLRADGRRTAPPEALWDHVTRGAPPPEIRSDTVQFALLHDHLKATGAAIEPRFGDFSAALAVTAPVATPA